SPPARGSPQSPSTPSGGRQATPSDSAQSPSKALPVRSMRTYAGPSRSFLVTLPASGADFTDIHSQAQDEASQESYADLRTRWGVDRSEDDPLPAEKVVSPPRRLKRTSSKSLSQSSLVNNATGIMNDLKSITELRNKGESRRFMDEVGYLFEGLDAASAIALRRTSALEIVDNLCDPDFNRRAKAFDFYSLTWDRFLTSRGGVSDKLFDAIIAFFAALAARDPLTLQDLTRQSNFVEVLVDILRTLRENTDILTLATSAAGRADFKSCGILRSEIVVVNGFQGISRVLPIQGLVCKADTPSVRFLISHTLAVSPGALSAQHLALVLASLEEELDLVEPRLAAYLSGSAAVLPHYSINCGTLSLEHAESCLNLLDSFLLGKWSTTDLEEDRSEVLREACANGLASKILSLCVFSQVQLRKCDVEEQRVLGWKCLCGTLRVLTLLSHGDLSWCEVTLAEEYALPLVALVAVRCQSNWLDDNIPKPPAGCDNFDLFCLSLGLLMNWATMSDKMPGLCMERLINPDCPGNGQCMRACQCAERSTVLHCLTTLYVEHGANEDDLPQRAFLRGYTAVLLGILIKDNTASRNVVLAALAGETLSAKLRTLVLHCRTFLDLYTQTATFLTAESSSPPQEIKTQRKGSWDKTGEEVAREVIASLELLCNNY
ncbi:hypothetical protein J3A83DRAFT_4091097, partial [Scleroderma citrinum]